VVQDRRRDEPAARCVDVTVAVAGLVVGVEALGQEELQLVLGAGHGDVEQRRSSSISAGEPVAMSEGMQAVDALMVDGLPFLALGRMDGGEDEMSSSSRGAGFAAGGVGRIERELGQELSRER